MTVRNFYIISMSHSWVSYFKTGLLRDPQNLKNTHYRVKIKIVADLLTYQQFSKKGLPENQKQARKPRSYASPKLCRLYLLTDLLTGVKCRATSVAKNLKEPVPLGVSLDFLWCRLEDIAMYIEKQGYTQPCCADSYHPLLVRGATVLHIS